MYTQYLLYVHIRHIPLQLECTILTAPGLERKRRFASDRRVRATDRRAPCLVSVQKGAKLRAEFLAVQELYHPFM